MKEFFGSDVLLRSEAAKTLYAEVKDLPIIDYHCHLNEKEIRADRGFADLGELWLGGDHYKWRAMRMCGVDEEYVTGQASFADKYAKYAEIFPRLAGNPLYYWTQLELALIFGIRSPLGPDTAEDIRAAANERLATIKVSDLLKQFKVEYVATTDDPVSPLADHGRYGDTRVSPTFRPDRMIGLDEGALSELADVSGIGTDTLAGLKAALTNRLDYFVAHGCRISDHGMDWLPVEDCGEEIAAGLYARRGELTAEEKWILSSHLLYFVATLYAERGMVMQLHFATYRNVNTAMFGRVGRDAGFDIMRGEVDTDRLVVFLDTLNKDGKLPKTVLYTLNPACVPALCTLSGAFPNVRIGAAWWFNDTVEGIRRQIKYAAEYTALGTSLGMLTDSRSFASYARFDFFRRILADVIGEWVDAGEYAMDHARKLMYDVCYGNVKEFLGL
ncbi:MAG: glucuronate isomerase [Ruminococcaceae bacterium]|nr:glucuronate isomerase [Oscillospiraceae bacterium]